MNIKLIIMLILIININILFSKNDTLKIFSDKTYEESALLRKKINKVIDSIANNTTKKYLSFDNTIDVKYDNLEDSITATDNEFIRILNINEIFNIRIITNHTKKNIYSSVQKIYDKENQQRLKMVDLDKNLNAFNLLIPSINYMESKYIKNIQNDLIVIISRPKIWNSIGERYFQIIDLKSKMFYNYKSVNFNQIPILYSDEEIMLIKGSYYYEIKSDQYIYILSLHNIIRD